MHRRHAFSVRFPMGPSLRKELGEQLMAAGLVGAAMALFEELELWDALILCYRLLQKNVQAEELVNRRLEVGRAAHLVTSRSQGKAASLRAASLVWILEFCCWSCLPDHAACVRRRISVQQGAGGSSRGGVGPCLFWWGNWYRVRASARAAPGDSTRAAALFPAMYEFDVACRALGLRRTQL